MSVLDNLYAQITQWQKAAADARAEADSLRRQLSALASGDPLGLLENIRVETRYTPVLDVPSPLITKSGPPDPTLSMLKPKLTLRFQQPLGSRAIAPWGEPGPSKWPYLQIASLVGVGTMCWLLYRGARSLLK